MFDSWLLKISVDIEKTKHKMKFFKKQNNSPVENSILNYNDIVNKIDT
jgi:hypothetical protein